MRQHDKIIACLVYCLILDEVEILQFWVVKEHYHKGYGTYFVSHILQKIRQQHYINRVVLEVRHGNIAAINLYTKLDFMIVGKRVNYYKVDNWHFDALIMVKQYDKI